MLSVVKLSEVRLSVIKLNVVRVNVIKLSVVRQLLCKLSAIKLTAITISAVRLNVLMMINFMPRVAIVSLSKVFRKNAVWLSIITLISFLLISSDCEQR
jgi:hypothetical protein